MKNHIRANFWIQATLASASALAAVVVLFRRDWVEAIVPLSPDSHSGAFEWELVVVLGCATALFATLARREWVGALSLATPGSPEPEE
jgi:hypothetical protein